MPNSITEQFLEEIEKIKEQRKVSYPSIAATIGEKKDKIYSIRAGRSSADQSMIDKLRVHYPEMYGSEAPSENFFDLEKRIAELERQNQELKNMLLKIAGKVL